MNQDISLDLQASVKEAVAKQQSLAIIGSGSKDFLQAAKADSRLHLSGHTGVIDYEPSELFITARAGTTLAEIETMLLHHNQMLACEPPHFDGGNKTATLGGAVACGFSGSRRPFAGSVRDHILGVRLLNGEGELLQFGGQVMKNVAGFDVSRLMVGARGTLGALMEISLKVLPKPEVEETIVFECPLVDAPKRMSELARRSMPLSALAWVEGHVFLRLEGTQAAIRAAHTQVGGEVAASGTHFWESVREQTHPFFQSNQSLWRLSLPPAAAVALPENEVLMDWCGGLRWWHTEKPAAEIEAIAREHGGYAYLFRNFVPAVGVTPPAGLLPIHQRLKKSFDPHGIFNPGIMGGQF
jgi:glycolate oxidase FAD binding subunit